MNPQKQEIATDVSAIGGTGSFRLHELEQLAEDGTDERHPVKAKKALHTLQSIKDPEIKYHLIELIEKRRKNQLPIAPLLACCWESGLDYGSYVRYFSFILINGTHEEALEALTVLNSITSSGNDEINQSLDLLFASRSKFDGFRSVYVQDAINHLNDIKIVS